MKGIKVAIGTALLLGLVGCNEPGWAKDEQLVEVKPPSGKLPPLPTSYFPPPTTEESPPPPPPPPPPPASSVTVTQTETVTPQREEPKHPVITIPLPGELFGRR